MNDNRNNTMDIGDEFSEEDEDTMEGLYLTFALDTRVCALEVKDVIEIVKLPPITEVPDMPDFVRGIINLRGKVIPVMEMRRRFHAEDRPHDDRTCVVIINLHDRLTGLIVDQVREVIKIHEENLDGSPRVGETEGSRFIKQVGKIGELVVLILDLNQLLNASELERFPVLQAAGQ